MPSCEMCGKELPSLRRATIEGTVMSVCGNCVKFGVEHAGAQTEVTGRSRVTQSLERRAARSRSRDVFDEMPEELVEDYGQRVRRAREARGLTLEQLGEILKTRRDTLAKVEGGSYHPEEALIRKLEKELSIKLKEKPEAPAGVGGQMKQPDKALTLGDLIKQQMDKGKK